MPAKNEKLLAFAAEGRATERLAAIPLQLCTRRSRLISPATANSPQLCTAAK